ncbi:hypothetical protein RND71_038635 [Anisodus tanguticus]|uniref:Uncharacterized protein n=1 Tax=Anisodus tanguticus TaxID=243964 RepID=A0AAE1UZC0_9SOLA|nr:hypothetical protein RND71_038635 [Anisodus tanguticus]
MEFLKDVIETMWKIWDRKIRSLSEIEQKSEKNPLVQPASTRIIIVILFRLKIQFGHERVRGRKEKEKERVEKFSVSNNDPKCNTTGFLSSTEGEKLLEQQADSSIPLFFWVQKIHRRPLKQQLSPKSFLKFMSPVRRNADSIPVVLGIKRSSIFYVESIARVRKLSLSGLLLYNLRMADQLSKGIYSFGRMIACPFDKHTHKGKRGDGPVRFGLGELAGWAWGNKGNLLNVPSTLTQKKLIGGKIKYLSSVRLLRNYR